MIAELNAKCVEARAAQRDARRAERRAVDASNKAGRRAVNAYNQSLDLVSAIFVLQENRFYLHQEISNLKTKVEMLQAVTLSSSRRY